MSYTVYMFYKLYTYRYPFPCTGSSSLSLIKWPQLTAGAPIFHTQLSSCLSVRSYHGTPIVQWELGIFQGDGTDGTMKQEFYPLVMADIAIENGHL